MANFKDTMTILGTVGVIILGAVIKVLGDQEQQKKNEKESLGYLVLDYFNSRKYDGHRVQITIDCHNEARIKEVGRIIDWNITSKFIPKPELPSFQEIVIEGYLEKDKLLQPMDATLVTRSGILMTGTVIIRKEGY